MNKILLSAALVIASMGQVSAQALPTPPVKSMQIGGTYCEATPKIVCEQVRPPIGTAHKITQLPTKEALAARTTCVINKKAPQVRAPGFASRILLNGRWTAPAGKKSCYVSVPGRPGWRATAKLFF